MKKLTVSFTLVFLILVSYDISICSQTVKRANTETDLTLKEAIKTAQKEALNWNKEAKLPNATDIDKDKKITGGDGKRRYWNILFGVPDTNKQLLVQVKNAEVAGSADLTNENDTYQSKIQLIDISEIKFDTPELLKKAKKITKLYPGDEWAKG